MRCMADAPAPAAARHVPGPVRAYAAGLMGLTRRLDPRSGWYARFAADDPHGLQECLSGRELPPWDVVASLLQDFGRLHGAREAVRAEAHLRALHGAAAVVFDAHAGGEPVLRGRLTAALRELDDAEGRVRATEAGSAAAADLARARDHLSRSEARCAELRARLRDLEVSVPVRREDAQEAGETSRGRDDADKAAHTPRKRRARPGGSRFAGAPEEESGAGPQPVTITPPGAQSPGPGTRAGAAGNAEVLPRGARFAGAVQPRTVRGSEPGEQELAAMRVAAAVTVTELGRLRGAGRGGEAHALLSAAAGRPAARLAVLVEELQRSGMDSDAGILLWEVAGLPPAGFAAAADALSAAGRNLECARLLRQGVSRPLPQIADAAVLLHRAGRTEEVTVLLGALIRSRGPAEAAGLARAAPSVLVGALLAAAGALSADHHRAVANALRGAGLPGVPSTR